MITSATQLLNEIVVEIASSKLGTQTSQISEYSQKKRQEFAIRYPCMQSRFLRLSWLEKIQCLTQLLEGLTHISSLSLVLNIMKISSSKPTIYAESQYSTNFVYDKALHDHNRTLHKKVFNEAQKSDLEWFKTLGDSEQILIFIGIIRLGGGSVVHHIYKRGVLLYDQKVNDVSTFPDQSCGLLVEIKPPSSTIHKSEVNIHAEKHGVNFLPTFTPRTLNIKSNDTNEEEKWDPQDPCVIEVVRRRKIWDNAINKYKIQVEGKPANASKKDDKSSKSSMKTKSDKSTKSGKSSKSSKGKKNGKGGESEELDQIQLLPIWVVKKIFSYLDAKTLRKGKGVNKYWAYAISDVQKEQKTRKALTKLIKKMQSNLPVTEVKYDEKQLDNIYGKLVPIKRLVDLSERGAITPKLRGHFKKRLFYKSITTEAVKEVTGNYILPVTQFTPYPRNIARAGRLWKSPSCLVNALGFTKIQFKDDDSEQSVASENKNSLVSKTDNSTSGRRTDIVDAAAEKELNVISV